MTLKPQDLFVALKLVAIQGASWSFASLAGDLGLSPSQVHASVQRLLAARLAIKDGGAVVPNLRNLDEFLVHGVKYVFVPDRGELTRGLATAPTAPLMGGRFIDRDEFPWIWPDSQGESRGLSFSPLHKSAPFAARKDPTLYELLVLVDAIRGGREKERKMAIELLRERLSSAGGRASNGGVNGSEVIHISEELSISRPALEVLARRYHIRKLTLFGSAARGELGPASDIDLLVEFEPGQVPSLGGMHALNDACSSLFCGRKVDLATPAILANPYRRRAIEKDMEELYAA